MTPGPAGREARPEAVPGAPGPAFDAAAFRESVLEEAAPLWRDLPWRRTSDPYLVWTSEAMLQQTQVARVAARWDGWVGRFPTVQALAEAPAAEVLDAWQGMGYNRRALALKRAAETIVAEHGGQVPRGERELLALPGVGPATAAGVRAFAFDEAGVYLETNVRAVFISRLFESSPAPVPDRDLVPYVRAACPPSGQGVRAWYWALLDLGAHLKRTGPNPTRRSASYARQSPFEGSFRQKRAEALRALLAAREQGRALSDAQAAEVLARVEEACGRPATTPEEAARVMEALERDGLCAKTSLGWEVAG